MSEAEREADLQPRRTSGQIPSVHLGPEISISSSLFNRISQRYSRKSRKSKILPPQYSPAQSLGFEILKKTKNFITGLIVLNFVVVIVETDAQAKDEDVPMWADIASLILLCLFVLELGLRLFTYRRNFTKDNWNIFDFIVISVDVVMTIVGFIFDDLVSVSGLRILRLGRLARAAHMFPELRLLMAGLGRALDAIFWGTVLLFVTILLWSVIAVQLIHPLNKELSEKSSTMNIDTCNRCPRAFSTTFQAALTFSTQIVAGDSWGKETVPIIEEYPATAVFFLAVYMSVGLAILNLILGVVVNAATEERERIMRETRAVHDLERKKANVELYEMCKDMDEDGNDELTYDEIKHGFDNNDSFRRTLAAMDIGAEDIDVVWTILDEDKSGTISAQEFADQVYKLKNSETQFMLAYVRYYVAELSYKLLGSQENMSLELRSGQKQLQAKLEAGQQTLQKKLRAPEDRSKVDIEKDIGVTQQAIESDFCPVHIDTSVGSTEAYPHNVDLKCDTHANNRSGIDGVYSCDVGTPFLLQEEEDMVAKVRDAWHEYHGAILRVCKQHAKFPKLMQGSDRLLANMVEEATLTQAAI